jgi:hypothetical protein
VITGHEDARRDLAHCRASLLRFVEQLDQDQLDRKIFPTAKSLGEMLLHIAGYEFLVNAALEDGDHLQRNAAMWSRLKPGFAYEAGFAPPIGLSTADYRAVLTDVRMRTERFLEAGGERRVGQNGFRLRGAIDSLAALDGEAAAPAYSRLFASADSTFKDDARVDDEGRIDWVTLLLLHETYHRGQMTFQRYAMGQITGAS